MSIDSVDVQTLTTVLLSFTQTRTFQAGLASPAFFLALTLLTIYLLTKRKSQISECDQYCADAASVLV